MEVRFKAKAPERPSLYLVLYRIPHGRIPVGQIDDGLSRNASVGQDPRGGLKPLRPYLTRGFDFESRVKAILSHYEIFATKHLRCSAGYASLRKKLQLAMLQGKKGEPY